ncbi:MAG: extensin family protein [Geminicoccaceae bacterium]|nr:extensin family protein [Geminicoccaceae bacterium]
MARLPATLLLLLLVAGCGGGGQSERADGRWSMAPSACTAALAASGVRVLPWTGAPAGGQCRVAAPVELLGLPPAVRVEGPGRTSCSMALAIARLAPVWDRLAQSYYGSGVDAVLSRGSYGCRGMSGNRRRLSLHANALAFDVGGFRLRDGRTVDVASHWSEWGRDGRFLRAAARAACETVNLVLTPNTDRYHQDHLHLDLGPWRRCDA